MKQQGKKNLKISFQYIGNIIIFYSVIKIENQNENNIC